MKKIYLILLSILVFFSLGFKVTNIKAEGKNDVGSYFQYQGKSYKVFKKLKGNDLHQFRHSFELKNGKYEKEFTIQLTEEDKINPNNLLIFEPSYIDGLPTDRNMNIPMLKEDKLLRVKIYIKHVEDTDYPFPEYFTLYYDENNSINEVSPASILTFALEIKDSIPPEFQGQKVFVSNVDNPSSVDFIKSQLRVYDDVDREIPNSRIYVISDNYTANKKRVGSYEIVFGVKDNFGNEARLTLTVKVLDLKKPILELEVKKYKVGLTETIDLNAIKKKIKVTDNYDKILTVYIKTDYYTENKTNIGKYNVVFAAKDTSNNEAELVIEIQVRDTVKPTISGNLIYKVSYRDKLDLNVIKSKFAISDNYDKNLTTDDITIKLDNYTLNQTIPSKTPYLITFSLKDSSDNETLATVQVFVVDDLAPQIITNDYFITLDTFNGWSREQILTFLINKRILTEDIDKYSLINDNYSFNVENGKIKQKGTYLIQYKSKKSNDIFNINILADNENVKITTWDELVNKSKLFLHNNKKTITSITLISVIVISILVLAIYFIAKKKNKKNNKIVRKGRYKK